MTERRFIILVSDVLRAKARAWIDGAEDKTRVEFKAPKRTLPQNDRFYAMLTDVAEQVTHFGMRLDKNEWKHVFLDALRSEEPHMVPTLDGAGFIHIGRSSSDLSVREMSDAIELMFAYGARHGVVWRDPTFCDGRSGGGVNNPPPGRAERVEAA